MLDTELDVHLGRKRIAAPPAKELEGKGRGHHRGSSGIGLATTRRFVAEGAHVFITGRRQAERDSLTACAGLWAALKQWPGGTPQAATADGPRCGAAKPAGRYERC
jgi:hypothetical protein